MTRKLSGLSLFGMALAVTCALGYADWFLFAPELVVTWREYDRSLLLVASSLIVDRSAPDVFQAMRTVLAVAGITGIALGALILHRAHDSLPARIVAWLLIGYAALTFKFHFLGIDPRYRLAGMETSTSATIGVVLAWLAVLGARFLVVFPRPVDGDSVMRSFWARRRRAATAPGDAVLGDTWETWRRRLDDPAARSVVLLPWHRRLVDGGMVWLGPLGISLVFLLGGVLERTVPWDGWGGVWFTISVVVVAWYLLFGLPFAYASASHLYANGSAQERRRIAWLRAVILGLGVLLLLVVALAFATRFVVGGGMALRMYGAAILLVVLIPTFFVMGLAFAVLYGGALDPRIAVTRFTLWSVLGLGVTLGFLLLERFVAVKVIGWLSLPPDSGAVIAGTVLAGTFIPVRRVTERAVTRLADRYLPISVVADGVRVVKAVMVSDLSGYTALSATDEQRALLLGALLKRQAERIVGAHGGKVIKSMGDAIMATFDSGDAAVLAALDLHKGFPGAADAVGAEPLPLHTALHRGEIVESHDGDIYGQTVNVTARLVDASVQGGIVLSGVVRETLAGSFVLRELGERRFKNVPAPVVCFRVDAVDTPVPAGLRG